MDSFRNALIIGTTLGAIIFSFSKFFINLTYESIMQDFELGAREARSKHVIFSIFAFFIGCFYILVFYIIFKGVTNQTGNEVQNENTSLWIILGMLTFCMFCISVIGSYIKKNIYVILSKKRNKLFTFLEVLFVLSFIVGIVGLIYSEVVITLEDSSITPKSIETRIYKDGIFLARMNVDKEFEVKDKDNAIILINYNVVGSKMVNKDNNKEDSNNREGNYLIILNDKKFYIKVTENIQPIKGDKITFKINNEQIGSAIFQDSYNSIEIQYIIKFIVLICIFYPLSMLSMGLAFSLHKLMSIKTNLIRLNSDVIIGKIVVKYDDFYVVYIGDKYQYISKSRIIGLEPIQ